MGLDADTLRQIMIDGVESDLELIMERIKDHVNVQPYQIQCNDCGNDLNVHVDKIDGDLDIYIYVDPCATCMAGAREDG